MPGVVLGAVVRVLLAPGAQVFRLLLGTLAIALAALYLAEAA